MVAQVQILEPWSPGAEAADTPGMSVVGPLHGPKNRLTPSAALCPLAAWALQGYSGPSQVCPPPSVPLIPYLWCKGFQVFALMLGPSNSPFRIVVNLRTDHSSQLEQAKLSAWLGSP